MEFRRSKKKRFDKWGRQKEPSETQKLRAACIEIWKKIIRTTAKHQCIRCREEGVTRYGDQPHHIFGVTKLPVDLDAGVCLCFYHHRRAHSEPLEFREWVIKWRGENWYGQKYLQAYQTHRYDWKIIQIVLTKTLEELGGWKPIKRNE